MRLQPLILVQSQKNLHEESRKVFEKTHNIETMHCSHSLQ